MTTRHLAPGLLLHPPSRTRHRLARALRSAGALLARLARQLQSRHAAAAGEPVYEFYAQAGAPEGALYVDGKLVALLPGVSRL